MLAKYAGTCSRCGKAVEIGQEITWNRKRRGVVYHMDCTMSNQGSYGSYESRVTEAKSTISQFIESHSEQLQETQGFVPTIEVQETKQEMNHMHNGDLASVLANAISEYLPKPEAAEAKIDESKVREIVKTELSNIGALPTHVQLTKTETGETKDLGIQHKQFALLLSIVASGCNVWITGPEQALRYH